MQTTLKDFITLEDWSNQQINKLLDSSIALKKQYSLSRYSRILNQKTLFMIFFEQSTRTRNSMEAGMTQLGGHAHDLTANKMQLSHGETTKDTAQVLARMGEGIAIRNCFHNIGNTYLNEIAQHSEIPVISMQDDVYHPLQGIADLMTIQEYFGENLKGLKIAVSWAYATSHSKPLSVPQTQALLFPRFGMDVVIANPPEFPLQKNIIEKAKINAENGGGNISFTENMEEAVKDADIVIPKNWGGFAHFDSFEYNDDYKNEMKRNLEKYKNWIYDDEKYNLTKKNSKIMHALPADRGNEVTDSVLDSKNSIIYDEAENRLHTAKAILSILMDKNK